ncbi:zinc ribbon domain-containing protein [Campylobacter sp. RM9344]|uniref:Zinc ribbon domain-containing protein n=1 Tax=Campylobacter californiensis TaxID=1032243 RepID=A0AAW3ZVS1_9BACT|nr:MULTISPECIES: zinc ribbon domain-containing protein [unclassified Campylobacter]MBE2983974.1 zinc ribbon domain-containing protein [Campylobacter sp. RM6883]MBE2986136.1 zinc ribbon domain-containing protein [Campylobacter sp. RM12919]MBE2987548.1 zinc ribbon domain-containing protein [Campylobacter sp. RM12920]MBE2994512.1 zinc ribbon domain-containing protein [Campylobacter sp. RM6913]MBE3022506.1 zinc ribbon domain-containing protein [Campylobacter sp. 7477a]MBE3028820.1 zinc ribbon dom
MNKYLQQLVELSKFDKEIDDFTPRIENVQKTYRVTKEECDAISANIEQLDNEVSDIKVQKSQTNAHIAEFAAKIKDVAKKSGLAKSEKEVKALNLEEEIAKEQLEAANEEIARLEKIIDSKNASKEELVAKKSELEAKLTQIEAEISSELEAIEKERAEVYAQKTKLVGEMNQKILTFYEKIRKWAHNSAVVPVRKQACYGCFMQINDKTFAAVVRAEDIVTCPHCGRILYKENI